VWGHIGGMSKSPRVVFQPKRITETDWQIEASIPGSEIRIISGLTSKLTLTIGWAATARLLGSDRRATQNDPQTPRINLCPDKFPPHFG